MDNKDIQGQINDINRKLDIVLEEVMAQKETRQSLEDLTADLSIVGTDMFKSTVTELDNAGIEVDGEALKMLAFKLIRNIDTINQTFEMLESANDFIKDVTPILHQVGLDSIKKFNEFEERGYIDFFKEATRIFENVMTHFSVEDVRALADSAVTILETVKSLTQPEMLQAINSGLVVYKSIDVNNVPEYSLFKAMREMNSKEMKRGIGFMITFLKNISKETTLNANKN
ncbi:MAG: hypothetical protein C0598_03070 [Marinilabiliales bacterium]|nr:MAG: hypothetical protein C0598_03070 [Marinilabiliales bacterium]